MRRYAWRGAAVVVTALVLGAAMPSPAQAARDISLSSLLRRIPVAPERPAGYDRDLFPMWSTQPDGCDTRQTILIDEALRGPQVGPACAIGAGRWFSPYDGVTVTEPGGLDIDHVVALAEAWASGARRWSTEQRRSYANDLGYVGSLIAVTASVNRSKGDQDPAEWLPPRTSYRCTYVQHWIGVKYRWRLSMDSTEKASLRVLARACGNPKMAVPRRAMS